MPTSTAATTMRASSPAVSPPICTGMRSAVFGRTSCGNCRFTASVRALRLTPNHCTPMARPGMRSAAASSGRRSVATTYAPVPQSAPTGRVTRAVPAGTSCVRVVMSRSPITLSVTLPAVRAVTATVIVSPAAYCGLSSAISSMSGVSALASAYQPASKLIEVTGPLRSPVVTSSR